MRDDIGAYVGFYEWLGRLAVRMGWCLAPLAVC